MDDKVLDPLKYYEGQGKQEHRANIEEHLNGLIEKSGIDIEENRETMAKWKKEQEEIASLTKVIKKFKLFRILLIAGIVVGSLLTLSAFGTFGESFIMGLLKLVVGGGALAASIVVMIKKVNPVIKDTDTVCKEHTKIATDLENEGWVQMRGLNTLFTDEDAIRLVEKTLPEFSFDKSFTVEHEKFFVDKYDFFDLQTDDCSMIDTLSGKHAGNPFLYGRRRVHKLGTQKYHGSLKITWTETYKDSQGRLQTRTKTETLKASVDKPKPFYRSNTFLAYGNQAAPNLSFSRVSQHSDRLSEKALEKRIKKGEHKLQKQASKDMKNGGNFQEMANSEFDVLFGATDRDNEVEFRLMYTPLAQRSTVDLIKDSKNYGDDFDFIKQGKCNIVSSDHAQKWDMSLLASDYKHFNFEEIKSKFISKNANYFKSIFFDFAPFFCVPAYLDEPCVSMDSDSSYKTNFTYYEHEVMANALDYNSFVHEESCTEAILKTQTINVTDSGDLVAVTANSYMGIDRIDYVSVKGGDGNYHNVPVPWIEYIPVSKTSHIFISKADEPNDCATVCYHGMGAGIVNN
ncbi:MAG: hypothetical protein J6B48_00075 [Clostridia bacterium]|nr:hypothetical protein [Clostridia bacterium]